QKPPRNSNSSTPSVQQQTPQQPQRQLQVRSEPRPGRIPGSQQRRPGAIRLPSRQPIPPPISRSSPLSNVNSTRDNHNAGNMTPCSNTSHGGSDSLFAARDDQSPLPFGSDPGTLIPDDQGSVHGSYPGTPAGSEGWVEQSLPKPTTRV